MSMLKEFHHRLGRWATLISGPSLFHISRYMGWEMSWHWCWPWAFQKFTRRKDPAKGTHRHLLLHTTLPTPCLPDLACLYTECIQMLCTYAKAENLGINYPHIWSALGFTAALTKWAEGFVRIISFKFLFRIPAESLNQWITDLVKSWYTKMNGKKAKYNSWNGGTSGSWADLSNVDHILDKTI